VSAFADGLWPLRRRSQSSYDTSPNEAVAEKPVHQVSLDAYYMDQYADISEGNDLPTPLRANYGKKQWDTHPALVPVGTMEDGKSPYGIYDMAGNAWKRVSDWYDKVSYKKGPSQNPKGPEHGDYKVLRGSSWHSRPESLHSANRNYTSPEHHPSHNNGFRCAKTP
jgi:formylglycine-generating enzyme required for sulfatase activity